nr:MAG TPA: hypothetical protein [Bacteriophage sp.]
MEESSTTISKESRGINILRSGEHSLRVKI